MFSSACNRGILALASGGGRDSDALAWASAVVAAGGTYSASTLTAVSAFVKSAKASGYWTKLNRINLLCGDQLAAALVPLKVGGGSATDTNNNFVAGDYTEATGLTGNASTKFLNTGLVASVSLTLNDTHLAVYNRSASAVGGNTMSGCDNGSSSMRLLAPFNDGSSYSDQYNSGTGRVNSVSAAPYGLIVGSRPSSASHAIYQAGSSLASNATSGGVLPAFAVYVFAQNGAGTAGSFTSHILAAYSIGSGLSAADVTAYNTHMQAFQAALSRSV